MNIDENDIVGTYKLSDGNKYIFLANKMVYKEEKDGTLIRVELTKENIKRIQDDIGTGETDIIR